MTVASCDITAEGEANKVAGPVDDAMAVDARQMAVNANKIAEVVVSIEGKRAETMVIAATDAVIPSDEMRPREDADAIR